MINTCLLIRNLTFVFSLFYFHFVAQSPFRNDGQEISGEIESVGSHPTELLIRSL